MPAFRRRVIDVSRRLGARTGILVIALVLLAVVAFLALPATTHLLGDGRLHLGDLERLTASGVRFTDAGWANENAPLANWTVWALHRLGGWTSPLTTYRLLDVFCGALYVLVAVLAARRLAPGASGRGLLLGFLLTGGWVQLFAGYVELYALLPPLVLLYVATGASRPGALPWIPAAILGVLVPLHFATATLAPSLAVLAVAAGRAGRRRAAGAAACVLLPVAVSAALLAAVGFDAPAWLRSPREANLLPFFADPGFRHNYRLLDPAHFRDVLNQYLLVAPAAVLGLALLRRREADPAGAFLFAAAAVPVLFTFLANPEVGPFRDWDTLSFAAVPFTVAVGRAVAGSVRERGRLAQAAVVLCGAAALHTAAWLALNTNAAAAETRFVHLLETCPVSLHARAYGWESVGSLRLGEGRTEEACAAFENAVLAAPDNPRHLISAGKLHLAAGRADRARECFAEALRLDPSRAEAWFGLGTVALGRRDAEASREAFLRFLALEPEGPRATQVRSWIGEE